MRVDSLVKLRSMVRGWRKQKKCVREPLPEDMLERARRATVVHGMGAVIRATGIQHKYLTGKVGSKVRVAVSDRRTKITIAPPTYSRIELPMAPTRPLAEAETPGGVKIRVFAITPETISLLSILSEPGRAL